MSRRGYGFTLAQSDLTEKLLHHLRRMPDATAAEAPAEFRRLLIDMELTPSAASREQIRRASRAFRGRHSPGVLLAQERTDAGTIWTPPMYV